MNLNYFVKINLEKSHINKVGNVESETKEDKRSNRENEGIRAYVNFIVRYFDAVKEIW